MTERGLSGTPVEDRSTDGCAVREASELGRELRPGRSATDDRVDAPCVEQVDEVPVHPLAIGTGEQVEARRALHRGRVGSTTECASPTRHGR